MGRAERDRPGQSGRRPWKFDGPDEQLSGVLRLRGDPGVRRLQGAGKPGVGHPVPQYPRGLHQRGGNSRRLYREGHL